MSDAVVSFKSDPLAEIVTLHGEIADSLRANLPKALRIGELLAQTKAALPHGEFGRWCESLPFTGRTSRNYMRLWRERDRLKTETVSDLTAAYKLLAAGRRTAIHHPAGADAGQRANRHNLRWAAGGHPVH